MIALLETFGNEEMAEKAKNEIGAQYIDKTIATFGAAYTEYELQSLSASVDYSKGILKTRHISPLNDDQFDRILALVKSDSDE